MGIGEGGEEWEGRGLARELMTTPQSTSQSPSDRSGKNDRFTLNPPCTLQGLRSRYTSFPSTA